MQLYPIPAIMVISIHSTARVETNKQLLLCSTVGISIHSTARVETLWNSTERYGDTRNFNPLHREGGDGFCHFASTLRPISIHSTARVETASLYSGLVIRIFQSTPPRGWRQYGIADAKDILNISIHSTARVETIPRVPNRPFSLISIHSTARVETSFPPVRVFKKSFQSTPPRGWRRLSSAPLLRASHRFQSTPPRGWRPCPTCTYAAGRRNFNPLHREGGDTGCFRRGG